MNEENKNVNAQKELNTIVIKDDNEKSPYAASWASLWYYIKKLKYWIIGIILILTILGFTIVKYIYNASNEIYTVSFSYKNLPFEQETSTSGTTTYKYLNGDNFVPESIVSITNMESVINQSKLEKQKAYINEHPNDNLTLDSDVVKNISGDFDGIDYKTISQKNQLRIEANKDENLTYDIICYSSAFSSKTIATNFIKALIENVQLSSVNSSYSFDSYLQNFDSDTSYLKFSGQIDALQEEIDYLFNYYNILSSFYNSNTELTLSDGTKTTISEQFMNFKTNTDIALSSTSTNFSIVSMTKSLMTYSLDDTNSASIVYLGNTSATQADYQNYFSTLISDADSQINTLQISISNLTESNKTLTDELTGSTLPTSTIAEYNKIISSNLSKISSYTNLKNDYEKKKLEYQNNLNYVSLNPMPTIEDSNYKTLVNSIANTYNTLLSEANKLSMLDSALKENNSLTSNAVTYLNNDILETSGGIKSYIGIAAGLVLGILISCLVAIIYGQEERRKAYYLGEKDPIIPVKEEVKEEIQENHIQTLDESSTPMDVKEAGEEKNIEINENKEAKEKN